MKSIEVKGKIIGDGYPAFIIAEMAWSHDGSIEKAKKIIKGAADANADAISIHITSMEDYMVPEYKCEAGQTLSSGREISSMYEGHDSINLKEENWVELFPYIKKLGLIICVMCNDRKSFELCKRLKPDIYVLSPASFVEYDFIKEIAKEMKPIILRIGGALLGEIEKVITLIKDEGTEDIILLHGIQLYPTKIEDTHLGLIDSLRKIFSLQVGLADHIDGDSDLALIVPLVSLPFGATVIEKHITYNRDEKGEDYEAALNPKEFKKFVSYVREVEKSVGSYSFRTLSEAELRYRDVVRKRTVAKDEIKMNEKITAEKITFKRADEGAYPDESKYLIGRTAKYDIKKNEPITWDKIL